MKKPATPPKPRTASPRLTKRKRRNRLTVLKFLPAILLIGIAAILTLQPHMQKKPHTGVLSYATSVSVGALLNDTNAQRSSGGLPALGLNSKLNAAAQAKVNDMVTRNYWSHVTPEGNEPWIFITNAGYQYATAGENLAYGFATSSETLTGWMNSAPHRANILNGSYTEVGFGIANSSNYNNDGEQTVVVAMYASPQTPTQSQPVVSPQTTTTTPPPSAPQPVVETAPEPVVTAETVPPVETVTTTNTSDTKQPVVAKTATVATKPVRRVQILTGGKATWSASLIVFAACGLGIVYALQRGLRIKRVMLAGEHFITHHLYLDATVAGLLLLSIAMVMTVGKIR